MPIKAATSKDIVAVHLRISDNPKMATLIISNLLTFLLLAAAIVSGLPASDESKISTDTNEENSTLILDLVPPIEGEDDNGKNVTLFIINLYAVRNHSGESSEEMLDNNLVRKMPDIIGPLATLFLLVEEGEDEEPVDLDKMAKYMEERGLKIDKIEESGETSVLKTEVPDKDVDDIKEMLESTASEKLSKSKKYRARRMACHKCHGGGGRGGGGGKGGGGGGGQIGVIPVYVVPVAIQQQPQYHPPPQQYHPPPQQYHPQPVCDPCQGRGGGGGGRGGGGGGIAYAQASAQASAGGGGW